MAAAPVPAGDVTATDSTQRLIGYESAAALVEQAGQLNPSSAPPWRGVDFAEVLRRVSRPVATADIQCGQEAPVLTEVERTAGEQFLIPSVPTVTVN